jgi:hypothetical protein
MASAAGAAPSSSIGLMQEVADETDEERRKRLLAVQQQNLLPGTSAAGRQLGSFTSGYSAAIPGLS